MQIKKGDRFQISGCLYRVAGYWSHDVVLYPVARDDDEVLVYTPDEIKDEVERGSMLYHRGRSGRRSMRRCERPV
jgi:hypothetical protein